MVNNVDNTIFSGYLLFNRITDTKIINRGSGIRVSWVDFIQKINKRGERFTRDSRVKVKHTFSIALASLSLSDIGICFFAWICFSEMKK